jgi:hypothetical protein
MLKGIFFEIFIFKIPTKKKKNCQSPILWFKWIAKNIDGYFLNDFDISCKAKFG